MKVSCRTCIKKFSTNTNRNKHERLTGHGPKDNSKKVPFDTDNGVYLCPTANCNTSASTKRSIMRHLKNCSTISKNRRKHEQNKVCKYCQKRFQKKFNRDRHIKQCHDQEIDMQVEDMHLDKTLPTMANQVSLAQPDEEFPTMVDQTSPVQPDRESQNLVEQICPSIPSEQADSVSFIPASPTKIPEKSNYLEEIIMNIKKKKIISDQQFEKQFSQNLIFKLKNDLKTNKKGNG